MHTKKLAQSTRDEMKISARRWIRSEMLRSAGQSILWTILKIQISVKCRLQSRGLTLV